MRSLAGREGIRPVRALVVGADESVWRCARPNVPIATQLTFPCFSYNSTDTTTLGQLCSYRVSYSA
eukprot:COSAG01_NODE_2777_length_7092_cov_1.978121_1_plen_65_part_10